jgi:WD40 repeat protein/HEAT repeat protein
MESNKHKDTQSKEASDQGSLQVPAFLLPAVLASLGLDDADVHSTLTPDILFNALHDKEYQTRVWAVRALGRLAKEGLVATDPLLDALNDKQWQVRATAVFALSGLGASAPLKVFEAALYDEERAVRAAAVRAIALLNERDLIAPALSDPDWLVRESAVLALGEAGSSAPVLPLVSALKDEDSVVRKAAMWALQQAHPTVAAALAYEVAAPDKQQIAIATQALVPAMQTQATNGEDMPENADIVVTDLDELPARVPHTVPVRPRGRLWRFAEGAVAAILVASIVLSWVALARHFNLSAPAQQNQPVPTLTPVQGGLPPTHPAKLLFDFHGKGEIFLDGWTPDGRYLGFINDNPSTPGQFVNGGEHVYAWDAATRTLKETFTLPTLPAGVQGNFGFGPGRYLLFLSDNGLLQVWDFVSGRKVFTYHQAIGGWVYWGWSNGGQLIALNGQNNGQIEIWNVVTGQKVAAYSVPVQNIFEMLWSPDDRYIAAASNDRVMMVWDAMTGKVVLNVPHYDVEYVQWSPNGQRLFAALPLESQVQVWNVFSQKLLLTSSHYSHNVQWSFDGAHIISYEDNQWLVWDARTGRTTLTLPFMQNARNADNTSNDYRYFALSNSGNTVQIWDTVTGREVLDYGGHASNVRVLATGWAPDNRHVASLDSDGRLLIWDALTGKTLYSYQVKLLPTPGLFWSPDGRMITLVSQPNQVSQPPFMEIYAVGAV